MRPTSPRIVSLLPSATEMIYALGLGDSLVAVSHECDYPSEAKTKPKAVRNRFPTDKMKSKAIERQISAALRAKESLYALDLDVLRETQPDVIVTQELCDVCAITGADLHIALRKLKMSPTILAQTPRGLQGIFLDILELGNALGVPSKAKSLVAGLKKRMVNLRRQTRPLPHPKVYAMEWLDPPYAAGHWVPELVEAAGGLEVLGQIGRDSEKTTWKSINEADPEIIVLMPCGFNVQRARQEARGLARIPQWNELTAVREGRVYAVDANAYFSRPGPRVVEGAELLAHLFLPKGFNWKGPAKAFSKVSIDG